MNWKKVIPLITIVIVLVVLFYVYKYVVKIERDLMTTAQIQDLH